MALKIEFTKTAEKEFSKAPFVVQKRVRTWVKSLKEIGWAHTCSNGGNGLHDEPLQGSKRPKKHPFK